MADRPSLAATMAVTVAIAAAGCGSAHRSKSPASTAQRSYPAETLPKFSTVPTARGPTIDGCMYANRDTRLVRFRAPGETLRAAVVGTGATGVVLANQTDNSVCQWQPLPTYLAAHGMRVLAFDYGSGDSSAEVQAAALYLRDHGVRRIVLVGASIGGAVIIDAGVHMHPAPAAVVSLSAVPDATMYPFPADARRLKSPVFQIASVGDSLTQLGRATRGLFHASPSPAKRLLLLPGAAHGVDLIGVTAGNRIRRAILAFIRAHT